MTDMERSELILKTWTNYHKWFIGLRDKAAEEIVSPAHRARLHLREWQANKGYTNQEAADKIGCGLISFRNWKDGRNWPSSVWMPAIARAFDCTIEELYFDPSESGEEE